MKSIIKIGVIQCDYRFKSDSHYTKKLSFPDRQSGPIFSLPCQNVLPPPLYLVTYLEMLYLDE